MIWYKVYTTKILALLNLPSILSIALTAWTVKLTALSPKILIMPLSKLPLPINCVLTATIALCLACQWLTKITYAPKAYWPPQAQKCCQTLSRLITPLSLKTSQVLALSVWASSTWTNLPWVRTMKNPTLGRCIILGIWTECPAVRQVVVQQRWRQALCLWRQARTQAVLSDSQLRFVA